MKIKALLLTTVCIFSLTVCGSDKVRYTITVVNKSVSEIKCQPSYCVAEVPLTHCAAKPFETMTIKSGETIQFKAFDEVQLGSLRIEEQRKTYNIDSTLKDWKKRMNDQTWTYLGAGQVKIKSK